MKLNKKFLFSFIFILLLFFQLILVADTVPAAIMTSLAIIQKMIPTRLRVVILLLMCLASYLILGLGTPSFTLIGVIFASLSRGMSDVTFLGLAAYYHKYEHRSFYNSD